MRLKSIEMQGFKSFADKIYLDFNSGITAIVGPNGSGKSNISDAIRWVMGEQSVKSLRGSKMEDVIFAGTESRKALGFAEVTLSLDNEDGYFDLEFPEIAVTRRVYRSGESEYYINKTNCRLKAIHELFMDTGLGRDGYSIIGQGQIDNILSTKSEDRRQIFEEAAGISKYKYRKTEAEKKLAQANDNITRVEDILSELSSQLEPLRKQSEKARKYLVYRDEMKDLEIGVSIVNTERIRSDIEKIKADIAVYSAQIADIKAELSESDKRIEKLYEEGGELDGKIEESRQREKDITAEINELENRINLTKSDIEHSFSSIERINKEYELALESINSVDSRILSYQNELNELDKQNRETDEEIQKLSDSAGTAESDASAKSEELESIRSRAADCVSRINALKSGVENLRALKDSFAKRKDAVESELRLRDDDSAELEEKLGELGKGLLEKEKVINSLRDATNELEEKYGAGEARLQKLNSDKNKNTALLGSITSKLKMLKDMERDYEGYSKGVKSVMTAHDGGRLGGAAIHGPLSQLIKTDKEYITAIETALAGAGQNIITDNAEDAKKAIAYLKKRSLGRATFLPIDTIKPRSFNSSRAEGLAGYISTADKLVRCDERYRNIVSNVLGATVVADNIDDAVEMGKRTGNKFRIVTLGGDEIRAGGAMTGGSVVRTVGALSRSNEIEELQRKAAAGEKEIAAQAEEIKRIGAKTAEIMEDIKNNNDKLSAYNDELIRMSSDREHCKQQLETIKGGRARLEDERRDVMENLSGIDADTKKKNDEIEELSASLAELEKRAEEEQKRYADLTGRSESLAKRLTELSISKNVILKDMELKTTQVGQLNNEKSGMLGGNRDRQNEIEELRKNIEEFKDKAERLKEDVKSKNAELEAGKSGLSELILLKRKGEDEVRFIQESTKQTRETMYDLSQKNSKAESRLERQEEELEKIITRLWDEYELTFSEAAEYAKNRSGEDFDFSAASARIKELRASIRALGNINIDSIEEYKNVKERYDFLTVQIDDLEKSRKELEKVISDMLSIMKTQFAEQFKIINTNFSRVFGELFGGGKAELTLVDPNNVLESGIKIEAQPPGKKLQSLTLLSGGERAFTAIALLFAILDVRPTPFCILDEIEAALDDVNVYRFAEYLKNYSETTQFIVVTHRRGTMEAANILYGVTMQEKGISKVLALNIDEVVE